MNRRLLATAAIAVVVLAIVVALFVSLFPGIRPRTAAERHPAARTVDAALKLRYDRSTDATAYARYFLRSEVATQLAQASKAATAGPPVPKWDFPYVSSSSATSASVIVVWRPNSAFAEWPYATLFKTQRTKGRWVITDAESLDKKKVPGQQK